MEVNFYLLKGYALGRGVVISRIDRAEVISRADADMIRREMPRDLKKYRAEMASV